MRRAHESRSIRPDEGTGYPQSRARRRFLEVSSAGLAALAGAGAASAQEQLSFSPAAFDATADSVLIWVCAASARNVRIDFSADGPDALNPGPVAELARENDYTRTVVLDGLPPDRVIHYRVVDAASGKALHDICTCRTAPIEAREFTFAFSADQEESYQPFRLFDAIARHKPELFLHLGDTVYADHPRREFTPSVAHYRRKHAANRRDDRFQRFLCRHTCVAIWDDHETENNCHAGHPAMAMARRVFLEYWPSRPAAPDGLYRRLTWAGADFIILDTRSYRSAQSLQDGPEKTMLGDAQKQWFKQSLSGSKARFKFVATSVPFHGGGVDTWGSYRTERRELQQFIRDNKIGGVVFLTGDYHLARDWTSKSTGLREFMAGPIASFTHYERNPHARDRYAKAGTFHHGDSYNFALVRVDPLGGNAVIEWIDNDAKVLGRVEFAA